MATMSEHEELKRELDAVYHSNEMLAEQCEAAHAENEQLRSKVARLSSQSEPEARHTLDCDMVKHPNCTRCNCGSSVDPRIESLSGGDPSEKSASGPADHRGIAAARSSEVGNVGKIADVSIQSREPVDSNTVSGGAGELEALRVSSDDPAQSVSSAPPPSANVAPYLTALVRYIDNWYGVAMKYGVPAKDAACQAKHAHDAVLGIRKLLGIEGEYSSVTKRDEGSGNG